MARILVCMTGASGAIYGLRLLAALARTDAELHFVGTPWAARVVLEETGLALPEHLAALGKGRVTVHAHDDLAAPPSSGSFRLDATVIVPCSMGTAGAIAANLSANLVQRAAAVALKEGRPLVLVPRETPLSLPALRSLLALREAGAIILPACPGFYTHPTSVEELVDQVVFRIMDRMGLPVPGAPSWGEGEGD